MSGVNKSNEQETEREREEKNKHGTNTKKKYERSELGQQLYAYVTSVLRI